MHQLDMCLKKKERCQVACDGDVDCPREGDLSAKVMLVVRPMCNEGTICETGRRHIRKGLRSGTQDVHQATGQSERAYSL